MAPKKATKMSLNAFLGDNTLGSWADEMDSLPTAPAARSDEPGGLARAPDRGRRDDFLSSRSDRGPPREDLPLPTEPPYTAFIGNLAFDLTEPELEEFFAPAQAKSVKIIRDRDDRPKGFGYIEFVDLDGLKDALAKSGSNFAGRTVRVSVAEPPKERPGFGGSGSGFDDEKFAGPWRRDGPLPDLPSRDGSRRRFDGPPGAPREPPPPSVSDTASDWRAASRGPVRGPSPPRFQKRASFREDGPASRADAEDTWSRGANFKPSVPPSEGPGSRFGSMRGKSEMGPPKDAPSPPEEGDWRRPHAISRNSTSPSGSTPPTPQMGRRKLELLPRSGGPSATPSPLASPNPTATSHTQRANPFGAAKPVDVSAKEHEVSERLEKEREATKERTMHAMSRTSSRQASQRGRTRDSNSTPGSAVTSPVSPSAEFSGIAGRPIGRSGAEANVRPSFSFASAAAGKKDVPAEVPEESRVEDVAETLGEVTI